MSYANEYNFFYFPANTAATISGIAYFLNYSVYFFLEANYSFLSLGVKLLASLMSNTAMAFGSRFIIAFEGTAQGVQWSNLFTPPSPDDTFTLGAVMLMMLFDTIFYMLLAVYIEAIFPGDFGVPQPWNFPFKVSKISNLDHIFFIKIIAYFRPSFGAASPRKWTHPW
jgi:ATP-binding cassette, subfamily A (ABC1), member 3